MVMNSMLSVVCDLSGRKVLLGEDKIPTTENEHALSNMNTPLPNMFRVPPRFFGSQPDFSYPSHICGT